MLVFVQSTAQASDKGIKSEMVWSSVDLFCSTSIAEDLAPLVSEEQKLPEEKANKAAYQEARHRLDQQWKEVSRKHREAIRGLALTARLNYVPSSYVREAANEAWELIRKKCPARAKRGGPDEVFTFLTRRIPELE